MNFTDLEKRLKAYTPVEKAILDGSLSPEDAGKFSHVPAAAGRAGAFVISMNEFISPGENIGIHRQDRFCGVAPHSHDYIELAYLWSGSCIQEIEGQRQESREGDLCVFDTQAVHAFGSTGEEDLVINILVRKEFFYSELMSRLSEQGILSEFLVDSVARDQKRRHYLYFETHGNRTVRRIMEEILMEYYGQDMGNRQVVESYLVILFTELLRFMRRNQEEAGKRTDIYELLAYIEKNYEHCTLPQMAKHFGFNGNYLTSLLKEQTGRSFLEHVQEQKLQKACSLLKNTDLSIQELVPLCGYANVNFFYKKFQKEEGCTPAQYRARHRKN